LRGVAVRGNYVKAGLNLLILAICMVILATFFHEDVSGLLSLSSAGEARFVFLGLFWGGVSGCVGILLTVVGIVRNPVRGRAVPLGPTLIVLAAIILLFFFLLYSSFNAPEQPRLRPGETITI
jgi:hypothetical protein